jgi:hypothetical protein
MGKQINFYATETDKIIIAEVLKREFGQLIIVPYHKTDGVSVFEGTSNGNYFYLAEENRQNDILYHTHEYADGSKSDILSDCESPVLEYSLSYKNRERDYYIRGRFYSCSDDTEFSKKVSNFFAKLKREFWYAKKWQSYVSKSIDVENSLFFIPNRIVRITKEDIR